MGYDALVLAKLSGGEVLTVECESHWCEVIKDNVAANPDLNRSVAVLAAFVDDRTSGDGHRVAIDDLVTQFFVPQFIKIDIEGGEVAALRGASRTLSEHKPGLLIEVHSLALEAECLEILRGHGYAPDVVNQRRVLPDYRPLAHNRWIIASGRS